MCAIALGTGSTGATAATTFTWTGGGAAGRWSDAANWGAGAPAASDGEVNIDLAAAACTPQCAATTDDVSGLTAGTLTAANIVAAGSGQSPSSYSIAGTTPLTLDDGLDVASVTRGSDSPLSNHEIDISPPITLGADNSWSIGASASVYMSGAISGMHALAVSAAGSSDLSLYGAVETGPVTVTDTGISPFYIFLDPLAHPGDLNGTDGQPVSLSDVDLTGAGSVGPLTMHGGDLYISEDAVPAAFLQFYGALTR